MPKAIVTVTIELFDSPFVSPATPPTLMEPYDIADSSDTERRVVVKRPSGKGSAQGGAGPYEPGSIAVDGKDNLDLKFHVVDNASPPGLYIVCGLLFSKIDAALMPFGLPPKTGRDIFTEFNCDDVGDLTVQDVKKGSASFHFLLLIQNINGGVGIIDPLISNH